MTLPFPRRATGHHRASHPRSSEHGVQPHQDAFGVSVVRTVERLRATGVDEEIASLLRVAPGAPLLQIRRVALTYSDVPVELRISHVNTAHHEYWSELNQH
jgi:GntR family transcriptional regulator